MDFDYTLAWTGSQEAAHLGGVQWRADFRKHLAALHQTHSLNPNAPLFECLTLLIAKSLPARAVQDKQTAELIGTLEKMGCQVVILTARGRSGENAWYKLNISGVDTLTKEQLENAGITITPHPIALEHSQVFENRMIFAQNGAKDLLLSELFAQKVLNPSDYHQVLGIDDKKDAAEKLSGPVGEYQIPYIGMHYILRAARFLKNIQGPFEILVG